VAPVDLQKLARSRGVDLTHWPPSYDKAYRPRQDEPDWLPELERAEPAERDQIIFAKLSAQLRYAWEKSPFYRRKWQEAGVSPDSLRRLEDLSRFPVVQKHELRAAQASQPPYGDYLCIEPDQVARIHGTSGTTGRPTVFGIGTDDWARIAEAHARILWAAGIRPEDRVLICSFFSLYLGSWGALAGVERLGATAFPFGAGVSGQTLMAVQWARELRPTAFYGTPSYAMRFAEISRREGIDPLLWAQFHPLEDALQALGVMVWPMVEFEADDALAAAARISAADPRVEQVVVCTPDKDLAQCVQGDRVVQLDRRTREVRDESAVRKKFGVSPASIPDWLALVGDSADGYP